MSTSDRRRWFLVPGQRVIDAAPVAGIVILLSIPNLFPVAFALLHVWLWLRHPRARSRYTIAGVVVVGYLLLAIGMWVLIDFFRHVTYNSSSTFRSRRWAEFGPTAIGVVAAAGIVPILYRLLSRHSLTFVHDPEPDVAAQSRGSIADILFLSIFAAVTFVTLQNADLRDYSWESPLRFMAVAVASSLLSILSMRMLTHADGRAAIGIVIGSMAIGTIVNSAAVELALFFESEIGDTRYRVLNDMNDNLSMMIVYAVPPPLFALVMYCCGVVLSRDGRVPVAGNPSIASKWVGRLTTWIGATAMSGFVAVVCFAPVWSDDYATGGWPLTYLTQINGPNMDWVTIGFSTWSLLVDGLAWALICLAIMTPKLIKTRLRQRPLRIARVIVLSAFVGLMIDTCYLRPARMNRFIQDPRLEVGTIEDCRSFIPAVIDRLEKSNSWLPQFKRETIAGCQVTAADAALLQKVLAMPRLQFVHVVDCDISTEALERLRDSYLMQTLAIKNCSVDSAVLWEVIASLPRLEVCVLDASQLHIPDDFVAVSSRVENAFQKSKNHNALAVNIDTDGRIYVPPQFTELMLITVSDEDRVTEISGNQQLQTLHLFRYAHSDTVLTLTLRDLPELETLKNPINHVVDVSIVNAPKLGSIFGNEDSVDRLNRVLGLNIQGPTSLEILKADVSQCDLERFQIGTENHTSQPAQIVLNGRRQSKDGSSRMPEADGVKLIRGLPSSVIELELHGFDVGQDFVAALDEQCAVSNLNLFDCKVADNAFEQELNKLKTLTSLEAQTYAPSDAQFANLVKQCNLLNVNIDGSKLTTAPQSNFQKIVPR